MTSEDIASHAPSLGFEHSQMTLAACNWLREIAWQLAVLNEHNAREWARLRETQGEDHES